MAFAAHVTTDTSVTPRIYSIDSNRSCADEALPEPELRSSPASADIPEFGVSLELPRSEKGGETTIHSPATTRSQMGEDFLQTGLSSGYKQEIKTPVVSDGGGRISRVEPDSCSRGDKATRNKQRGYTSSASNQKSTTNSSNHN